MADTELTIDQAVGMMNGTPAEPVEKEVVETVDTTDKTDDNPADNAAETPDNTVVDEPAPTPTVDLSTKVTFKANGVEQEKTVQELITAAQLAENYNRNMEQLAQQRKAFELAQPAPVTDPAAQYESLDQQVTDRAMKMLGIKNPDEFSPDASINRIHFAVYQQALAEINYESQQADYAERESQMVEQTFVSKVNTLAAEPDFLEVNKFAEQELYKLPQNGPEGIAEFNKLYPVFQKLRTRDAMFQAGQDYRQVKLTAAEVTTITNFYEAQKTAYVAQKNKPAPVVVPKGAKITPTVKVESGVNDDPAPAKKLDFNKIRNMDLDDIVKML